MSQGKITKIINQQGDNDGDMFIATLDNGNVRIGWIGGTCVDGNKAAFCAAATLAAGMDADSLEDLLCAALR